MPQQTGGKDEDRRPGVRGAAQSLPVVDVLGASGRGGADQLTFTNSPHSSWSSSDLPVPDLQPATPAWEEPTLDIRHSTGLTAGSDGPDLSVADREEMIGNQINRPGSGRRRNIQGNALPYPENGTLNSRREGG